MSENVEVVRRANAAVNEGDVDALAVLLHPDMEWEDLQPRPGMDTSGRGSRSAIHWVEEWRSAFDQFTADVHEYVDLGDHVLCVTSWRGIGRHSGLQVEGARLDLYEVRRGRIVRALVGLPDRAAALEAAGIRA
jgi:ketosteroid isomerase-like protein